MGGRWGEGCVDRVLALCVLDVFSRHMRGHALPGHLDGRAPARPAGMAVGHGRPTLWCRKAAGWPCALPRTGGAGGGGGSATLAVAAPTTAAGCTLASVCTYVQYIHASRWWGKGIGCRGMNGEEGS